MDRPDHHGPSLKKIPPTRPLRQRQHLRGSPTWTFPYVVRITPKLPQFLFFPPIKRGDSRAQMGPKAQMSLVESPILGHVSPPWLLEKILLGGFEDFFCNFQTILGVSWSNLTWAYFSIFRLEKNHPTSKPCSWPFGRDPTTRSLGDYNDHHGYQPRIRGPVLRWSSVSKGNESLDAALESSAFLDEGVDVGKMMMRFSGGKTQTPYWKSPCFPSKWQMSCKKIMEMF